MIVVAGLLILVAGALLVGGLGNGETAMLWGSVAVSALAALALVLQTVQRRRAVAATVEPAAAKAEPAAAKVGPAAAKAEPASAEAGPAAPAAEPAAPAAEPAAATAALSEPSVATTAPDAPEAEPAAPAAEPAAESVPAAVAEPAGEARPGGAAPAEPVTAEIAALRAEIAQLRAQTSAPAASAETTAAAVEPERPAHHAEPARDAAEPTTGTHAVVRPIVLGEDGEPVEEDVVVTDLLLVIDLTDEVFVLDEHPRYHLDGCAVTEGQETFGLPLNEAKGDGFTACGICRPDRSLADAERQRRAAARS